MSLQCGIVGLPNVGKSTLFNCFSHTKAQVGNFPFCTIKPNIGIITVHDNRLNCLATLIQPYKIVPTSIEIVDIAGLVKGAYKGEGLGNQFLSTIRQTNAILHVLRCFDDKSISHVNGLVDPIQDKEIVEYELQLKDLETIESHLSKISKLGQTKKNKQIKDQQKVLIRLKKALEQGKSAITVQFETIIEKKIAHDLFLLTNKPILYICNVDESSVASGNNYTERVKRTLEKEGSNLLIVSATAEEEITKLKTNEERLLFLNELGLKESSVNRIIKSAYQLLNLETFLTIGPREVRAWSYIKGSKISKCAGMIHSDFEKGFIRAEVIKYTDFITFKSEIACKESGKIHIEGKEYVVQDGDIINFHFNV